MKRFNFTVPGEPKGKARPRFSRNGMNVRTYTPRDTVIFENYVRVMYLQASDHQKLEGPIMATVVAYFGIPQSVSKKRRERMLAGEELCTKKPDCDNIAKSVLDALNSVAYRDDAQVVLLTVRKDWSEEPRIEVFLEELE